jgi:CBS domain-containing protein
MSAPVITVRPDARVKEVAALLIEREIGAVPVVDESHALIGIVSEADLVRLEEIPDPRLQITDLPHFVAVAPRTAAEVMTSDVIALSDSTGVAEVARVMVERAVKHVPIVSAGRLVGIVARRDVLRVLARKDELIASDLETLFGDEALVLGRISIDVSDGIVTLDGPRDPRGRRLAQVLARSVPGVVAVRFAD